MTAHAAYCRVAVVLRLLVLNRCLFSVGVVLVVRVQLVPVVPALDPIQPNDGRKLLVTTNSLVLALES